MASHTETKWAGTRVEKYFHISVWRASLLGFAGSNQGTLVCKMEA
jgi:hypothetical protein